MRKLIPQRLSNLHKVTLLTRSLKSNPGSLTWDPDFNYSISSLKSRETMIFKAVSLLVRWWLEWKSYCRFYTYRFSDHLNYWGNGIKLYSCHSIIVSVSYCCVIKNHKICHTAIDAYLHEYVDFLGIGWYRLGLVGWLWTWLLIQDCSTCYFGTLTKEAMTSLAKLFS